MKRIFTLTFSFLLVVSFALNATNANGVSKKVRRGISGRITDFNGAGVPDAKITIVGQSSHTTVVKKSNAKGEYAANLNPGTYDVSVAAPGFKTFTRTSIQVSPKSASTANFVLEVGSAGSPSVIIPPIGTVKSKSGKTFDVYWNDSSRDVLVSWKGLTKIGQAATAAEALTKAEVWLRKK
jgi:hypothetical protein